MSKAGASRSGTGTSSIIVIVVVVCLTVFGVLALVTMRAEVRLTDRAIAVVAARYEAEYTAQQHIAEIDALLYESGDLAAFERGIAGIEDASFDNETGEVTIRIAIDADNILCVVLGDLRPGAGQDRFRVLMFKQINTRDWSPDSGQIIWNP